MSRVWFYVFRATKSTLAYRFVVGGAADQISAVLYAEFLGEELLGAFNQQAAGLTARVQVMLVMDDASAVIRMLGMQIELQGRCADATHCPAGVGLSSH